MNNPIFLVIGISIFWTMQNFVMKRMHAEKEKATKAASQAKAIAKLYPKGN